MKHYWGEPEQAPH